jgi:hypothetical protein
MAVIHRIVNEPPDLGVMEEPLRGIVADCLAKDPAQRPQTQTLLMRLLGEEGLTPAAPAGAVPETAIMGQGAAFAGTAPQAGMLPPAPTGPTKVAGAARTPSARAAMAALAGLLVAVIVVAVVWAASRGGDHPSGGGVQTPGPSSAPVTSAKPEQPVLPPRQQQSGPPRSDSGEPEPSTSAPATHPGGGSTRPGGGTSSEPDGGDTTEPGDGGGTEDPGDGGGGGGGGKATQPAAEATR